MTDATALAYPPDVCLTLFNMNDKKYKLDLHSHSIISHDGGITKDGYKTLLDKGIIDCIAITDHNETSLAQALQKDFGERIIVGEEIATMEGEIIGLFLQEKIPSGKSGEETIKHIQEQGGIVYIPHPFETNRQGMQNETLEKLSQFIAIMEVCNGRGFLRGKPNDALAFAASHKLAMAASSDAHSAMGAGTAYSVVSSMPTRETLVTLLQNGTLVTRYAPLITLLSPAINRWKKKFFV